MFVTGQKLIVPHYPKVFFDNKSFEIKEEEKGQTDLDDFFTAQKPFGSLKKAQK